MQRQLEPEYMDTPQEAAAYDLMDHTQVNRQFVDDLLVAVGSSDATLSVLDLGAGTALIPIELCRRDQSVRVVAVDAAEHMLDVARKNVHAAGLAERIELRLADAKLPEHCQAAGERYAVVMSNSLVHHLPDPAVFFDRAIELAEPGGLLFVRDLFRPTDEKQWRRLVETYAGTESDHARQMFADSLRAALTVREVRELVAQRGFGGETVQATSDRHWTWLARSG